jgi:hypothetical protein
VYPPHHPVENAASRRWRTDGAGYVFYYPTGPACAGYVIDDPVTECALRDADQRYVDWGSRVMPFASLLAVPLLGIFYWLLDRHPVAAFAFLPALVAMVVVIEAHMCWRQTASLLEGMQKAPPAEPAARRSRYALMISVVILTAAMSFVLRAYDERLNEMAKPDDLVVFYPSISGYLLVANFCVLSFIIFLTACNRMVAQVGMIRTLLALLLFASVGAAMGVKVNADFRNPRPVIALTRSSLICGWQVPWTDISELSIESGDRAGTHAQIKLANDSVGRCELGHLNAGPDEVFAAMTRQWRTAAPSNAQAYGATARLPDIAASRR